MKKQFYVYLHCKPDGTPFYVGKGAGGRSHVFDTSRNDHHKNIVAKHGRSQIQIFVFPCGSHDEAVADEIRHIAQLRAEGFDLCNQTNGGEGAPGYRHAPEAMAKMAALKRGKAPSNKGVPMTEETRAKVSAALKGRVQTAEHRAKNAAAQMGNQRALGVKASPEACAKRSIALRGLKRTPETRVRISEGQRGNTKFLGRKHTPETIAKISAAKMGNKANVGRVLSAESRAKISESRKRTNALRALSAP